MKASSKIFILSLLWIPVSLVAYNLLLKRQYLAGNLKPEIAFVLNGRTENYVEFKLPKFKYVVVSGMIASGSAQAGNFTAWTNYPDIEIVGDSSRNPCAEVNKYYQSLYNARVVNDTLFIRFYRERHVGNITLNADRLLILNLNSNTEYLRGEAAHVNIRGLFNPQHITIAAAGAASVNLIGLKVDQLNIIARDSCSFKFNDVQHTSTLYYSLLGKSKLDLNGSNIKNLKPGRVDSTAEINVTIKGAAKQKYLEAGQ